MTDTEVSVNIKATDHHPRIQDSLEQRLGAGGPSGVGGQSDKGGGPAVTYMTVALT